MGGGIYFKTSLKSIYRNNLKHSEFSNEFSQNFQPSAALSERIFPNRQGVKADKNFEENLTQPKPDSSSCSHKIVNVEKELQKIPKSDKEILEWFLRDLHVNGPCSYVLFGDKPMSIYSYLDIDWEPTQPQISPPHEFFAFSITKSTRKNIMKSKGWETWKKYRALFPSSNFHLFENHEHGRITLVMINEHNFLKTVEEHIDEFRNILGPEITPHIVLDCCVQSQDLFKDVLKRNDGLLGILLGYGRHNALLFSRRHEIKKVRGLQRFSIKRRNLIPSNGFATIEEEYDQINKRLLEFDKSILDDFNPLSMALPFFVADPDHPETKELKIKYRKQYKDIVKNYRNQDFLEVTLNQFCN